MKTAILTGASSGLGIQFARQLKRVFPEVEELWLIARRQDRLEALAAELTDLKTDRSACRREFQGVGQQIQQNLIQSQGITNHDCL